MKIGFLLVEYKGILGHKVSSESVKRIIFTQRTQTNHKVYKGFDETAKGFLSNPLY